MRRIPTLLVLVLALSACPGGAADPPATSDRDTLTRRQRDSVAATLPIPGARGVGAAMEAADAASARAAHHDSLLGGTR